MPGNGTGVIVTSSAALTSDGNITGSWKEKISFSSITDGTTSTFLAGEMHIPVGQFNITPYNGPMFNGKELVAHSRIGGPGVSILTANDEPGPVLGFGSAHSGTCNFVRADASTSSMTNQMDTIALANFCHRSDGNVTSE